MTPTQTFENYPEFANAGQKSQPTDAKYAAGFIPSDVLPAEWLNWFLNGATKGVTALNTGVRSVEQEINAVLESRAVTPDINADGQLLSVLNKMKAEAVLAAWPVGITYTQYPQQKAPEELFPGTTWEVVDYSGAFFRAEGGNADGFIEKTSALSKQSEQISSHSHSISHTHTRGSMEITGTFAVGMTQGGQSGAFELIDNDAFYIGSSVNVAHKYRFTASRSWSGKTSEPSNGQSGSAGGDENRPANFTVRIWKRVA